MVMNVGALGHLYRRGVARWGAHCRLGRAGARPRVATRAVGQRDFGAGGAADKKKIHVFQKKASTSRSSSTDLSQVTKVGGA